MLHGYDLAGSFSVTIFFIISGFLVTRSAISRSALEYIVARALRILPGLALAVLTTVFLIGPMLTKMPIIEYLKDPSTTAYLGNATAFDLQYHLADTTQFLPYNDTINGSLWTLPLECGFYLVILSLIKAGALTERSGIYIVLWICALFLYSISWLGLTWQNEGANLWHGISAYYTLKYAAFFMIGSGLYIYRKIIPLDYRLVSLAILLLLVGHGSQTIYLICVPYIILYMAIGFPLKINISAIIGDLSYGVYLLAFPVQQAVIAYFGPHVSAPKVSLVATLIVFATASFSWWIVEKPAMSLKDITLKDRAKVL